MDPFSSILAFATAAALLTITPGIDTALVLRTASVEGTRAAMAAGFGIVAGILAWGLLVALGLGTLLAVSEIGYRVLQYLGAAYLIWLGLQMLRHAVSRQGPSTVDESVPPVSSDRAGWFWRGVFTNLLNPKVGMFYVSFLPQFIPDGVSVLGFSVLLAAIHAIMGVCWFAMITLATRPLSNVLRRPRVTRSIDGITGTVMIAFGLRLVLSSRP